MYNKTSFINETDYAEVSGTRWIMRDLPNYAQGHQLCAKLCARIIQRSLLYTSQTPADRIIWANGIAVMQCSALANYPFY